MEVASQHTHEDDRLVSRPETVNLGELLSEIRGGFEEEWTFDPTFGVSCPLLRGLEAPRDLPPVYADPDWTRLIVVSLIRTILRYAPESKEIRLTARRRSKGKSEFVELAVRSGALRLTPEGRQAIFERLGTLPGSRADALRRKLGLGLYVARRMARKMGGDLCQRNGPGGSAFILTLPVNRSRK